MVEQLPLPVPGTLEEEVSTPAADVPELTRQASLRAAVVAFERHMRQQGFSENTLKAFVSDLSILIQFTGAGVAIGDVSTQTLNRFVEWLRHERGVPCNPKSLARRVTTLKVFFGWLFEAGVVAFDPADPVIHRPVLTPAPEVPTDAEVERVLAVTQALREGEKPDARPHLLITLLLHTGIKKSECMAIVLNHLDLRDPAQPVLWIRYANPRRRHKERKLPLPTGWPTVLAEYRAQYQPQQLLFPCTARNLEYVLADVAAQAGLPHGLSFEMLRWTCAVRDQRAGMLADPLRHKLGISRITWRVVGAKLATLASQAR
jgi:site-specific recombinase XerD